jgi:hypothetical protein
MLTAQHLRLPSRHTKFERGHHMVVVTALFGIASLQSFLEKLYNYSKNAVEISKSDPASTF